MKNNNRLGLAFCLGALLAYSASACATLPVSTPSETAAREAVKCLASGPCIVVQVDNQLLYDATVRVNGFRIGEVSGDHAATLFVHESLLIDGGCAQVSLFIRELRVTSISSKECVRPGGRFRVSLDPRYHAWLVPQGGVTDEAPFSPTHRAADRIHDRGRGAAHWVTRRSSAVTAGALPSSPDR